MKNRFKRVAIVPVVTFTCSILIGAGAFSIELRNVEGDPLVHLDAFIGGNSITIVEDTQQEYVEPDIPEPNDDPEPPKVEPAPITVIHDDPTTGELIVKVYAKSIYVNNRVLQGEPFSQYFSRVYKGQKVILQDEYADFYTYSEVIEFLTEKGITPEMEELN